jgi:hypothetical protein
MTNAVALAQGASNNVTFRNRIINGNMVISQRNGTSSVTPAPTYQYTIDRWEFTVTQSSKLTTQQNAGSVTPPAGFTNYLGVTSSSAYSVTATDRFLISQYIEGYNVADLAWGTANAKTITISAWVYSSLTGTFGGNLQAYGASGTQYYPFSYTISSANTWTQISITVPGNTTTAIYTNNSAGLILQFGLGVGSTYSGTAGSWSSSVYYAPTGAVSVVGTSGATFYITGVQLEAGTTASPFEYRQYGTELALCQRYYQALQYNNFVSYRGLLSGTGSPQCNLPYLVQTRATPTIAFSASNDGNSGTLTAAGITTNSTRAYGSSTSAAGAVYEGSATMQVTSEL